MGKAVFGRDSLCISGNRYESVCLHVELQSDSFYLDKFFSNFDDYGSIYCDRYTFYYESLSKAKEKIDTLLNAYMEYSIDF